MCTERWRELGQMLSCNYTSSLRWHTDGICGSSPGEGRIRMVLGQDTECNRDRIGSDQEPYKIRIGIGSGSLTTNREHQKINPEYLKTEQISQTQYWVCSKCKDMLGDKHNYTKYHRNLPQWRLQVNPARYSSDFKEPRLLTLHIFKCRVDPDSARNIERSWRIKDGVFIYWRALWERIQNTHTELNYSGRLSYPNSKPYSSIYRVHIQWTPFLIPSPITQNRYYS